MNDDELVQLRVQVLLHESAQLHDNIQRAMTELYRIPALGFPVLTGAFAVIYEGKVGANVEKGLLFSLFAVLAALLVIGFNNAWMLLCTFTRYKYAEVLPRLYAACDREGDNFGQYQSRGGVARTMIAVVIIQVILLPTALVASM